MTRLLRVALAVATVGAWCVFLYLDALWSECLQRAAEDGKKVYGEMYGPLSFFRPISMWTAVTLSVVTATWLALKKEPIQAAETTRGK
jgi:hypothetical protein